MFVYVLTLNVISGLLSWGLSSTIWSKYSNNDSSVSLHACSKSNFGLNEKPFFFNNYLFIFIIKM